MKTALVAAGLIGSPLVGPDAGRPIGSVVVDELAHLRAFHTDAFIATGGTLAFELVPVQANGGRGFLLSDGFPSPDGPMNAGTGWLFVRDAMGNGAVVLVNDDTSLRDLEEALEGSNHLEAEFAIAFDGAGAHLVGVLDTLGQSVFENHPVSYKPAPSLATEASALFPRQASVAFPERDFARDAQYAWPIDGHAQMASAPHDGLFFQETDLEELLDAGLPRDAQGWAPFHALSQPERTEDGWVLPPTESTSDALDSLNFDRGAFWGQRTLQWRYQDAGGAWQAVDGTAADLVDAFVGDLSAYGLVAPER